MKGRKYAEENKEIYGSDEYADITDYNSVKKAFQKGAEFGYNKANEEHFVKDGDLPKDEDFKLCISARGVYYIAKYEKVIGSWTNQEGKEVCCPNAWKETTLPKE